MTSKRPRIFYGYWILAACFLLSLICMGSGPVIFSFFVTSLEKAFDWGRTEIMSTFTVFFFCSGISGPVIGRLVHRWGSRRVILLGALTMAIGFVLLSQMSSLWQYYLGYILIGFGFTTASPVVTSYLIANWFIRRRGTAIGLMATGVGLSGTIFTPLVIVWLIPNIGWSNTYLTFAVIVAAVPSLMALLVIKDKPADMGLLPDGVKVATIDDIGGEITPSAEGLTTKNAISTGTFWLLAPATFLLFTNMGVWQNQTPHLEDIGFSSGIVASAITLFSIVNIISTIVFGWLCDKIRIKLVVVIDIVIFIIAICILLLLNTGSTAWLIWVYGIFVGLATGGGNTILPILVSTNFGLVSYATVFGIFYFFQLSGAAVGPMFAGYIYDELGTYHWAFVAIIIAMALAIPLFLAARRPTFPSDK